MRSLLVTLNSTKRKKTRKRFSSAAHVEEQNFFGFPLYKTPTTM